jgi:ferric-dicitrate binding protein FerR (iron transport regulator)
MNKSDVHNLINKYYNGDSTIEEERLLFDFLESDTSNDYQSEKAQFLFFRTAREEKPTKNLVNQINKDFSVTGKGIRLAFVMRAAAVLIIAVGLGYLIFFLFRSPLAETSTEANVQSEINLPDGSHVWIHSSSKIRYPKKFDKGKREVFLDGEAYFEITKDPARPFLVHTHETITQVVGTSFDLRNFKKEGHVELTVFTGRVIFGSDKKVEVTPGKQVLFEKSNGKLHQKEVKGLNALAWKTKRLQFEDTPIDEVLVDLTRYFNVQFEMKSKNKLNCHFSGAFNKPSLDDMLKALSFSMNIQFQLNHGKYYIDAHDCDAPK